MAHPIIIQEGSLRNYLGAFQEVIRPAQWRYFETVLMGLIHCQASRTLSGLLRTVAAVVMVWDLSRFLVSPRWSAARLAEVRYRVFCAEVQSLVVAAHEVQRLNRPRRQGPSKATVVTGYLILDDSTHVKRYAQKMGGQGRHYSSTDRCTMPGHSLFQGLYLVEGRQFPLDPQMYIQKSVCEQEQRPFQSKVDLAVSAVEHFEPLPETHTHVLIDSWYVNKRMWKAVKLRKWDLTGGLKANHKLRTLDAEGQLIWMRLDDFADELPADQFQPIQWPSQEGEVVVYVHLLRTRVKKLGAPYLPATESALDLKARELGLQIAPGANVHLLPNIAGYVGADHVAMLLATRLADTDGVTLAIDIGTNTEICLNYKGHMTSVSCASGPAFEDAHIKFGMRAAPGAIEHVRFEKNLLEIQTIAGEPPVGICGSGLLDVVAQLRLKEIIQQSGRMASHPLIRNQNGKAEFVLAERPGLEDISLSQKDVRELQLAKAAIRVGIQALVEAEGLTENDLEKVIIAGAFGTFIDVKSAIIIGMLPDLPLERFTQVGNAAGTGARLALISQKERQRATQIARQDGYIELARVQNFSRKFAQATNL